MIKIDASTFRGDKAWTGPTLANIDRAVVKLRWTDTPFRFHANDGDEVFAVMSGAVDMHVRAGPEAEVEVVRMKAGDILHLAEGEEHSAHPVGQACVLIVEERL
jgi:mannose-6-phosphate isomerase-like protein (cupin superfamily)